MPQNSAKDPSDFQTDLEILRSTGTSRLEIIQGKTSGLGRMFGPVGGLETALHPAACGLHRHRIAVAGMEEAGIADDLIQDSA